MNRVICLAWVLGLSLAAQSIAAEPKFDPAAVLADDTTIAVVGVDLKRVDIDSAEDWAIKMLLPPEAAVGGQRLLKAWPPGSKHIGQLISELRTAGADRLYVLVVLRLNGLRIQLAALPGAGANTRHIESLLADMLEDDALYDLKAGRSIILNAETVKAKRPQARGDVSEAFDWGEQSPGLQAVILPTRASKLMAEMLELLGAEAFPQVRQLPRILASADYATVQVASPPKPSVAIRFRARDDAAAKEIHESTTQFLAAVRELALKAKFPNAGGVLDMVQPKRDGRDVTVLSLNQAELERLFQKELRPAMDDGRKRATRVASMNNLRTLHQFILMDSMGPQGFPDDLASLAKEPPMRETFERAMVNPARPQLKPGYLYVKPPQPFGRLRNAGQRLLVYEAFDKWPGGVNVLFADGHVEWIDDQAKFEKLLKEAKEAK